MTSGRATCDVTSFQLSSQSPDAQTLPPARFQNARWLPYATPRDDNSPGKSPRRCEILGGTVLGFTQISNLTPLD